MVSDGSVPGSLCVVDRQPRRLTASQIEALRILSRAVVTQLEVRGALADFKAVEQVLPMCAWCQTVKDGSGQWHSLVDYVKSTVQVSHGSCRTCLDKQR